jgi:hypothetical protein
MCDCLAHANIPEAKMMTKNVRAAVDIDGSPQQVWAVLIDFAAYPQWNPFIVEAGGTAHPGSRLTLRMHPVGARAVTLSPVVREVINQRRLQWVGRLIMPSIVTAKHTFTIEPRDGGCRFLQEETFRGLLVPFLGRSLDAHTLPAFIAMNTALKARVERVTAGPDE